MGHHRLQRRSANLVLVPLLVYASGCALTVPAIPQAVPGYGKEYAIVDQMGKAAESGLLVMRSEYECSPTMIRAFDIRDGRCLVPGQKAVRFSYYTLMDFPIYIGTFENPQSTYIFPLVPRHVAEDDYCLLNKGRVSAPGSKQALVTGTIRVLLASPSSEAEMLKHVASEMAETPQDEEIVDRAARRRVLRYVHQRCAELRIPDITASKPPHSPGAK